MPPVDVYTQRYEDTATQNFKDLSEIPLANNVTNPLQIVAGPLGFGNAVQLDMNQEQCLSIVDTEETKSGLYDPASATAGFSVSLWMKAFYTEEKFLNTRLSQNYPREYIISTGGDTVGHPGVAIYQHGVFLHGVVSTGTEYWEASVPGAVPHDKWTNVGLRWAASIGVELLINSGIQGHTKYPVSVEASSDPVVLETTIGCRRNPDPAATIRYDGYSTVKLDEYSTWDHYLEGNNSIYFLGGYVGEPSYFTPEVFSRLLQDTDLSDPEQREVAADVLTAFLLDAEGTSENEEMVEEVAAGGNASSNSNNTANTTANDSDAAETKEFQDMAKLVLKLSDPSGLRAIQTEEQTRRSLNILSAACTLIKHKRMEEWKKFAAQEDGRTLMEFVRHLEQFTLASALAHARSDSPTSPIAATLDCVNVQLDTQKVDQFREPSQDLFTPMYKGNARLLEEWDYRIDRVEVPRDLFTDPRCQDRFVAIVSQVYKNLHKLQDHPLPLKAGRLNTKVDNFIDSRIISLKVGATQVRKRSGTVDPETPPCKPSPLKSKMKPRLTHETNLKPLRRLLFHANLTNTELEGRRCVWFNPEEGDNGAWQGEGCRVWQVGEDFTKCMCRQEGMYAVIGQMVENKVVPADPQWLVIIRYLLYGVSAVCLLVFILVVAFTGDLKEQFHLMGLCLAACLLGGSIFMVVSDMEDIRTDRHSCAAIGTLLHACYLGAGAWIAMIGHASFKCVTVGIVGGRMKQYGYLAAGVTLVSVGCTYTFFLNDLGNDPRCFISWYNSPKEVFFAPQVVFCGVALFCAIVVVVNLHTAAFKNKPTLDDYRSFSRGASLLIVYFSLTWSLAIVTYLHLDLYINFYPVFQILNALSGVVLLLCLGVCSSRFRMVFTGQAKLRREKLLQYMRRNDEGVQQNKVLLSPSVAPSPRPSGRPRSVTPAALSPSRPPSSNLEVPDARPRSGFSFK
ncbi:uncharacterized protein LOC127007020 isoform X2 [Eriocheir sinensis]|nr:uncharacterized protein LOC127007020 isoform X2 [Eriocheir sinensis]